MPHVVAPRKENIFYLNVKFPSSNLRKKAESVEVLDDGSTTDIFTVYFFKHCFKTHRQSLVILTNILFTFASSKLL